MVTMDVLFIFFYFFRQMALRSAMENFELDPRGRPDFINVFIYQEQTIVMIGLAVFFHTIYLIKILSTLNHIYGEKQIYVKI